jgi:predicted TIM-barrel fold metal-dependent hydrolase
MKDSSKYSLISADSHVIEPPDVFASLPAALRDRAPTLTDWNGGSAWIVGDLAPAPLPRTAKTGSGYRHGYPTDGSPIHWNDVLPALYDPAERIKAQDADGVDAEVLYPSAGLWDAIKLLGDAELKLACVRAYNDWIAKFCAHSPDRLIGLGKVPTTSVEDAIAEARRCVGLGLKGLLLDAMPSGASIGGNPADEPFWEVINEIGLPVSMHIGVSPVASTEPDGGIAPGLKPPMADVVLPMVSSGLFERLTNLKLVFAHADASWALHWLEFSDMYFLRHRHLKELSHGTSDTVPSIFIRGHFWFTFHHDRIAVRNRHNLGSAHLMWASHFPYDDTNWPDNRQQAVLVTAEADAETQKALMGANVARLYRLTGFEAGFEEQAIREFVPLVHY